MPLTRMRFPGVGSLGKSSLGAISLIRLVKSISVMRMCALRRLLMLRCQLESSSYQRHVPNDRALTDFVPRLVDDADLRENNPIPRLYELTTFGETDVPLKDNSVDRQSRGFDIHSEWIFRHRVRGSFELFYEGDLLCFTSTNCAGAVALTDQSVDCI